MPAFNQARVSSRWLIIAAIIIAVFVGFGLDAIRAKTSRRSLAILNGVTALATTAIIVGPITSGNFKAGLTWVLTATLVIALIALSTTSHRISVSPHHVNRAIVGLLILELLLLNRSTIVNNVATGRAIENMGTSTTNWLSAHPDSTIAITLDTGTNEYLVPALRPNAQALFSIPSIDGYDGGVQISSRWALTMNRFTKSPAYDSPLRNSISFPLPTDQLARLGIRYVLVDNTYDMKKIAPDWLGPKISDELFSV